MMPEADPTPSVGTASSGGGEMTLRVVSSLVLAPFAIFAAYVGGWVLAAFWGAAAVVVFWEWTGLVAQDDDRRGARAAGAALIAGAVMFAAAAAYVTGDVRTYLVIAAFAALVIGIIASAALAPHAQRIWVAGGIPYAGMIAVAPPLLRADAGLGFMALL